MESVSVDQLLEKKREFKIRLVRVKHNFVPGSGVSFTYEIQRKRKFLFLEWWQTIDTGYSDIRKARTIALSLLQENQPKVQIISEH